MFIFNNKDLLTLNMFYVLFQSSDNFEQINKFLGKEFKSNLISCIGQIPLQSYKQKHYNNGLYISLNAFKVNNEETRTIQIVKFDGCKIMESISFLIVASHICINRPRRKERIISLWARTGITSCTFRFYDLLVISKFRPQLHPLIS